VRDQPRPIGDPYRVLGLEPGASMADVKRAYRRLAKAYHPDSAGEAALPRFLAIHEAYERLVTGRSRAGIGPRTTRTGPTTAEPWRADPERARAARDRARTARGSTGPRADAGGAATGRSRTGTTGTTGPAGTTGRASGSAGSAAGRASGADGRSGPGAREGRRRTVRKATLGSTSYDDASGPFESTWDGGTWYGASSGTYWTINPKEYADPRKHGPEYQARARRAEQMRSGRREEVAAEAPSTEASETPAAPSAGVDPAASPASPGPPPPPTHTTSSWWEATTGDATSTGTSSTSPAGTPSPRRPASTGYAPPSRYANASADDTADLSTEAVIASIRGWLDDDHPTSVARIGRAVIGWAPIALGGGWLAGELTGCGRFAATCSPTVAPLTWIAQLGLLLLLILLPRLARVGTVATIAILGTVFPASLLLFATADPASAEWGRSILGGLIVLAWVVGLGFGIVREARRATRPVS